jgi:hypothetical protein
MPFYIMQAHDIADSGDMNANFYHIANGTRQPMTGVSLTVTNLGANLGSVTYKWNNLYANYLYTDTINSDGNLWKLLVDFENTSTTSTIILEGISSDLYDELKIYTWIGSGITAGSAMEFQLQDNPTNASHWQVMRNFSSTPVIGAYKINESGSSSFIDCGICNNTGSSFCVIHLRYKTGDMKIAHYSHLQQSITPEYISYLYQIAGVWQSISSSTLGSLYFGGGSLNPGGLKIRVWGKR